MIPELTKTKPTRRLRILWLSHFVPYPPKGGCFQRSYNLIWRVAESHDVHLVALRPKPPANPEAETLSAQRALMGRCASVKIVDLSSTYRPSRLALRAGLGLLSGTPLSVCLYRSADAVGVVREILETLEIDLLHIDSINLAEYQVHGASRPVVLTHHGAESFMMQRRIQHERSLSRRVFFALEGLMLRRIERWICPRVRSNVVVSDLDRQILRGVAPEGRFTVVENGVDVDLFQPLPPVAGRSLIFAGRMDQYANVDGMLYFMSAIWPRIVSRYPDATIRILGSNPPAALRALGASDPRVSVLGFVDDVRPHFAESAVVVCPLRDGGGTRIKILDAMAMGKPIVATTIACEGLDVEDERDLLIADDPDAFVRQLGRLFDDAELRARLARDARARSVSCFSWHRSADRLLQEYGEIVDGHST
jgi:polysaccharide biosynthesis protein PslH